MKLNLIKHPFPHIILEDFYDEVEYNDVWNEIMFLIPKMRAPDKTGTAMNNKKGMPLKKGVGVFLETFYQDLEDSNIFNATKKIHRIPILEEIASCDFVYAPYKAVNRTAMLVQIYRNGDSYLPHSDASLYTSVTLIHKEPKQYSGGEFYFSDSDYVCELQNNQTLIFPSVIRHGVSEVKMLSNEPQDARFTITQLMYLTPQ